MNQDVFLSLLALNVYNRGSTRSVFAGGSSIGDAIIRSPSSFGIPDAQLSAWENAGFSAFAYDWNGQTVISCRLT